MANQSYEGPVRDRLRAALAAMEQHITEGPLKAPWTELVAALQLDPAPATRVCPACQGIGMRGASRCGNCWAKLDALPPLAADDHATS